MKQKDVRYPRSLEEIPLPAQVSDLALYLRLSAEFGRADEGEKIYEGVESAVKAALAEFQQLVLSASDPDEPDALEEIRALRPDGPRVLVQGTPDSYSERLRGAFLGRMAGCTLGAALEFEPIGAARSWALRFGDSYPLTDYWERGPQPGRSPLYRGEKARSHQILHGLPSRRTTTRSTPCSAFLPWRSMARI